MKITYSHFLFRHTVWVGIEEGRLFFQSSKTKKSFLGEDKVDYSFLLHFMDKCLYANELDDGYICDTEENFIKLLESLTYQQLLELYNALLNYDTRLKIGTIIINFIKDNYPILYENTYKRIFEYNLK